MIVDRVRSLCRLSDHGDFANQYASFLTYLQQQKEHQFCHYMEETWSHRVEQWLGFARGNACMNTSMLERFHKRLKHELPDAKPNMRFNRVLEIIISLTSEMDEDHSIKVRSSQKKKQDTQKEQETLPSYAQDDVNFCAVCFLRDPKNPTDKEKPCG
ncbi:hypothetical protein COOONC_22677 [Cooperia oncophora]